MVSSTGPHRTNDEILGDVSLIKGAYEKGLFGGTEHEVYPELDRQSLEWRMYFTLPCALNYQRKSEGLWRAALATYNDPETAFVFQCAETSRGLSAFRGALTRHKLALQPEKHTSIWYRISKTLDEDFGGDPLNLFARFDFDVALIKAFVIDNKGSFPYIGGPKLLNYWLYMLSYFTPIPFRNRNAISVIPDLHVRRASVELGLVSSSEGDCAHTVAEAWERLLHGTGFAPCDLHAPLWRWSRAGTPRPDCLHEHLPEVDLTISRSPQLLLDLPPPQPAALAV
jgi:hypothetical protein